MENNHLATLDLSELAPVRPVLGLDIVPFLFREFVVKEDLFRTLVSTFNWEAFRGKTAAVYCSNDAILPSWSFMFIAAEGTRNGISVHIGTPEAVYERLFLGALASEDWSKFAGKRVLVKGCSNVVVPESVYADACTRLIPVARRVMYGEACSFVPVYRGVKEESVPAAEIG